MALEARIRELSQRHARLDNQINREQRSPAADSMAIAALKRQKLLLKEEVEQLRRRH